jgi:hypothetical protein
MAEYTNTETSTFARVDARTALAKEWDSRVSDPREGSERYMNESTVAMLSEGLETDASLQARAADSIVPGANVFDRGFAPDRATLGRLDSDLAALIASARHPSAYKWGFRALIAWLLGDERGAGYAVRMSRIGGVATPAVLAEFALNTGLKAGVPA